MYQGERRVEGGLCMGGLRQNRRVSDKELAASER